MESTLGCLRFYMFGCLSGFRVGALMVESPTVVGELSSMECRVCGRRVQALALRIM